MHLLIMNGASVYPQKYTEDFIPDSYLSKLTIHSFNSTDVNVPYACSYGFVKDVKVLKLTEEEFESKLNLSFYMKHFYELIRQFCSLDTFFHKVQK